jgi:hypothetical protein
LGFVDCVGNCDGDVVARAFGVSLQLECERATCVGQGFGELREVGHNFA